MHVRVCVCVCGFVEMTTTAITIIIVVYYIYIYAYIVGVFVWQRGGYSWWVSRREGIVAREGGGGGVNKAIRWWSGKNSGEP